MSVRTLISLAFFAVTGLSLAWTNWKSRRVLRESLGRDVKAGEDTSLRTWMQVSDEKLDSAARELSEGNPFDAILDAAGKKDMIKSRSDEHPTLK